MLVIDRVLYQATQPHGRPVIMGRNLDVVLAGALLIDLALAGRMRVAEKSRVAALPSDATGYPLLDECYAVVLRRDGQKATRVLQHLRRGLPARTYRHLAEAGLVTPEPGKALGLFPLTRWPLTDVAAWERGREELRATLLGQLGPTAETASALSVLVAARGVRQVLGRVPMTGREQRERVAAMEASTWTDGSISQAVRATIDATNAAIVSGMKMASAAGASG